MTLAKSRDSLKCLDALTVGDKAFTYYSLKAAERTLGDISHLPCSMRLLLENLIRHEDDLSITIEDMRTLCAFHALRKNPPPLSFTPARVLMRDETATSTLTDLAALRDALEKEKNDPHLLTIACHADIVAHAGAEKQKEKLEFLRWGQQAFKDLRVIPPHKGLCHRINLDYLTTIVSTRQTAGSEAALALPDTVLGTDPHLLTAGALGVLCWNADVLDLESILLGASVSLTLPMVLGVKLMGKRPKGVSATAIALTILKAVRQNNGAGRIVEFFGGGLDHLSVSDRALIASYLAAAGVLSVLFPIDAQTLSHLTALDVDPAHVALVEAYAKAQGLWHESWPHDAQQDPSFSAVFEFALESVKSCLGGPGQAHNPLLLTETAKAFTDSFPATAQPKGPLDPVQHGDVVWACIGPYGGGDHWAELMTAGLLARKARTHGLKIKPWVRAALVLTDPVMREALAHTGLLADLEAVGLTLTTDPDDVAPILPEIQETVAKNKLVVCALGTGLEQIDTPVHPLCEARYLAAPALILAFALLGNMGMDLIGSPVFHDEDGKTATLKDIWPSPTETASMTETLLLGPFYKKQRETLGEGDAFWDSLTIENSPLYPWKADSVLIRKPDLFEGFTLQLPKLANLSGARVLALYGNDVAAAQIAPSGPILPDSPAGQFLKTLTSAEAGNFADYAGNEEVMVRGAFRNAVLVNALLPPGAPEGQTLYTPAGLPLPLFEAAERYQREGVPLILAAGHTYGVGAGQEWAAEATRFLGLSIVIAESYAPAHRVNLIRCGVLPLQLKTGVSLADLKLDGHETVNFAGISDFLRPPAEVMVTINHSDTVERYMLLCRLDTEQEMETWRHGSLWAETLRNLIMLAG